MPWTFKRVQGGGGWGRIRLFWGSLFHLFLPTPLPLSVVNCMSLGIRQTDPCILALPLTDCVTWGKPFNLPLPQFPHVQNDVYLFKVIIMVGWPDVNKWYKIFAITVLHKYFEYWCYYISPFRTLILIWNSMIFHPTVPPVLLFVLHRKTEDFCTLTSSDI